MIPSFSKTILYIPSHKQFGITWKFIENLSSLISGLCETIMHILSSFSVVFQLKFFKNSRRYLSIWMSKIYHSVIYHSVVEFNKRIYNEHHYVSRIYYVI